MREHSNTKVLLANSFVELSKFKRMDKITISDITKNCGFSQPTFYNHFKDKYDLIVWIYVNEAQRYLKQIGVNDYTWKDSIKDGLLNLVKNRDFAINALKHISGKKTFIRIVQETNIDLLIDEIEKIQNVRRLAPQLISMIQIYCYGSAHFIFDWLVGKIDLTFNETVNVLIDSMPNAIADKLK